MPRRKAKDALLDRPYESADGCSDFDVRDRSERLAKPLTAVGVVVALACLASTAANIYFYIQKSAAQESSPLSCFHCDEIEGYPVDWTKVQQQREDSNLCCMQPTDFLNLVEKVSLATAKQALASRQPLMPSGTVSQIRPSVHLGLPGLVRHGGEARGCNVTTEIKTWTAGTYGHVRGELFVKSGRIVVRTSGIYQVYSQVSSDAAPHSSTTMSTRQHSIVRDNPSLHVVAEELLTTATTPCKDLPGQQGGRGGSSSPTSSYLGAALLLFRGDQVYVKASCGDNLKDSAAETYFGMYLV